MNSLPGTPDAGYNATISNTTFRYFLYLVFIANTICAWLQCLSWSSNTTDTWTLNYEAGFGRRSFLGTISTWLYDNFNIPLNYSAALWANLFIAIFLYYTYKIIKNSNCHGAFYLVLCSPLGISYLANFYDVGGDPEILIFAFLAAYTYHLLYRKAGMLSQLSFLLLFCCCILTHEASIFATPFLLLLSYKLIDNSLTRYMSVLGFALAAILSGGMIILHGDIDAEAACVSLLTRGAPGLVCDGAISFSTTLSDNIRATFNFVASKPGSYLSYIAGVGLSVMPILFYFHLFPRRKKHILLLGIYASLSMLPLFIIAFDWGRWFNLWYLHLVFTGLALGYFDAPASAVPGNIQNRFYKRIYEYVFASNRRLVLCLLIYSVVLYNVPYSRPGLRFGGVLVYPIFNMFKYGISLPM